MPRKFLKKYSAFQRHILAEFMAPEQLDELDHKYNIAKVERTLRELKRLYPTAPKALTGKPAKPFFGKIMEGGEK